jgi:deoxyribonuclease-4
LRTSDIALAEEANTLIDQELFHYIELMVDPSALNFLPFIKHDMVHAVHVPTEKYGVDIGDATKTEFTLKMIEHSLKIADDAGAAHVILHSGTSSEDIARSTLSKVKDDRIILENMPRVGIIRNENCLGYDFESMFQLVKDNNLGLCLDLGHAVKASIGLRRDYKEIISGLLRLKPKMFHLSDGDLISEEDNHLNIGEGQYDFEYFKRCIEKSGTDLVSIETPRQNPNSLDEDIKNIKALNSLWKQ